MTTKKETKETEVAEKNNNEISSPEYPPRLPKTRNFTHIEKLLYAYPGTKAAIKNLDAQIREIDNELVRSGVAQYGLGFGGSRSTGDVVTGPEGDADKRIEKKGRLKDKINKLRVRQDAIREAVNALGGKHERVVRVKYFQAWERHNPGGRVWREMGMKWETYIRVLEEVVEAVGRWIGEWEELEVKKKPEAEEGGDFRSG